MDSEVVRIWIEVRSTRLCMFVRNIKKIISLFCFKKILRDSEVEKLPEIRVFHHLFSPLRWVQMDIETKNLGTANVCRDERWLTNRATIPFALLDSNGLRDVYKYKFRTLVSRRKFFRDSQSPSSTSPKLSFLRSHLNIIWVNGYYTVKNIIDWHFLH